MGTGLSCLTDRHIAGQPPSSVVRGWPLSTGSDSPIGHATGTRPRGPLSTTSMRTTGAHDVWPTSAASQRCLRSCMRAVVCLRCCTSCCTELTLECQSSSVRLPAVTLASLALASSPRSQVRGLSSWAYPLAGLMEVSTNVRRSPCLCAAIVTQRDRHSVSHSASLSGPRAYYLLQYERVEHHETHRLEVSNYVIAASIVGLGFLGSSGDRSGAAWASVPVVIALINLLAILYAMRSRYWVDRHLRRAHMALRELSPRLVDLQKGTDREFDQARRQFLGTGHI